MLPEGKNIQGAARARGVVPSPVPETAGLGGLLHRHQAGVREASTELVALVAAEIRRIAPEQHQERGRGAGAEVQLATLLTKLLSDSALDPADRAPFLTVYARAVRRIVCDHLAQHGAAGLEPDGSGGGAPAPEMILAVDAVLDSLEHVNARLVSVVECLYFARLTVDETAAALRVDALSVQREWMRARAWLLKELTEQAHAAGRQEVSVTNAVWVDAVLRTAVAQAAEERGEFLEQCHAAAPGLRKDVEDLLRLSAPEMPGPRPGDLSAASLWSCLSRAPVAAHTDPSPPDPDGAHVPIEDPKPITPAAQPFGPWTVIRDLNGRAMGPLYLVERGEDRSRATLRVLPVDDGADLRQQLARECRMLTARRHPRLAAVIDSGETSDGRLFIVREYVDGRTIDRYCDDEALDAAAQVRLLVRVCAAVQQAHRQLVAHGALTPSNVVVGKEGEVTVVDCGIAPLLSSLTATRPEAWRPAVGSPEQLRGEAVTVMSDVYQLGALLGALFTPRGTGRRPDGDTVRGDLDAIMRLALRDDPEQRYPSVSALRSDLQRWLDRRPLWARRDTRLYRTRQFFSRRRVPLALAAIALLTAALVAPPFFSQRTRADQDGDRVEQVNQLLAGILVPADEGERAGPPDARTYVDRAATVVRQELAGEPSAQARLLLTIGRSYLAIGHYHPAIDVLEEVLALRRAVHGDDSLEVAEVLEPLGQARHSWGRHDEAEASLRMAAAIRSVRLGPSHPATLSANVALGSLFHGRGQLREAEQILRACVAALRSQPGSEVMTSALQALADVLRDRGSLGEAGTTYRDALALHESQAAATRAGARASTQVGLAHLLISKSELEEAEALLSGAVPVLGRIHTADHPLLLDALRGQARLRMEQARLDEARDVLQQAERIQRQALPMLHPAVPATRALQAELARRENRFDDAVASARLALEELERIALAEHPMTIDIRATLADALIALGRGDEAIPILGRAIAAVERVAPSGDVRTGRLRVSLQAATGSRSRD